MSKRVLEAMADLSGMTFSSVTMAIEQLGDLSMLFLSMVAVVLQTPHSHAETESSCSTPTNGFWEQRL